ncbi:DoxX family protein [Streptosporangium lutulentum]|uniref:Oxidoreductase n=1 Tax=Streptosporangium lutulentum TaxID=1461250 RepID=A0ABT9Q552_9ACTN|nr:DoxX family protein [Streptosporangium lutulentum]MDP9841488.1 putative oxidoreductase [Streptosporangium lutulentum]
MFDTLRLGALLLARIGIGAIFLFHGIQKFTTTGIAGVATFFESVGVPLPGVAAPGVAALEVVGGIALILGAALPVFGTLLALDMIGAIVFVHGMNGFVVENGGFEFVLALAAGSLAVGFGGGGAFAVDGMLRQRRRQRAMA